MAQVGWDSRHLLRKVQSSHGHSANAVSVGALGEKRRQSVEVSSGASRPG